MLIYSLVDQILAIFSLSSANNLPRLQLRSRSASGIVVNPAFPSPPPSPTRVHSASSPLRGKGFKSTSSELPPVVTSSGSKSINSSLIPKFTFCIRALTNILVILNEVGPNVYPLVNDILWQDTSIEYDETSQRLLDEWFRSIPRTVFTDDADPDNPDGNEDDEVPHEETSPDAPKDLSDISIEIPSVETGRQQAVPEECPPLIDLPPLGNIIVNIIMEVSSS